MARSVTEVVIPLTVRDLTVEDLPSCAWSGSATHLTSIARALERARRGEVDYLAVCPSHQRSFDWAGGRRAASLAG